MEDASFEASFFLFLGDLVSLAWLDFRMQRVSWIWCLFSGF